MHQALKNNKICQTDVLVPFTISIHRVHTQEPNLYPHVIYISIHTQTKIITAPFIDHSKFQRIVYSTTPQRLYLQ